VKIAMYQMRSRLFGFKQNLASIRYGLGQAKAQGAQLVIFPEAALNGYGAVEKIGNRAAIRDGMSQLEAFAAEVIDITAVVGFFRIADDGSLFNSAAVIQDGEIKYIYDKVHLVTIVNRYTGRKELWEKDEARVFTPGQTPCFFTLGETSLWLSICNDLWAADEAKLVEIGDAADVVLSINGSGCPVGERMSMLIDRAKRSKTYVFYVNLVDNDFYIGQSVVVSPEGKVVTRISERRDALLVYELAA